MRMRKTYRVEGLSCSNCSIKFENNVKDINSVTDASVNFGAGLIKVSGDVSIEEIEKAGAFENLKIHEYKSTPKEGTGVSKKNFLRNNRKIFVSSFLIIIALIIKESNGDSFITTGLFLAAILISGWGLFKEGFKDLLKFNFTMETLMTIAIIGASLIGEWAEGSIVVILFAISEGLERFTMDKARQSITSLMDIAPKEAIIIREGKEISIPVDEIQVDDIMIVQPGVKIAMDGVVISGESSVNQAAITGESLPIYKQVNDNVFAGTLNEEGLLKIRVTKLVEDTTFSKILHLVEEAQGEKAPAQAFVDKFSKVYTPFILILSLLIIVVPPLFFNGFWDKWIYQGLSLLVVGCPCSLVISTPVSIVSAITNAAKHGVLVKGGLYLEEMGHINAIAFDKTGTLTKGVPQITDIDIFGESSEEAYFRIMCALETNSQHPLASAFVQHAKENNIDYSQLEVSAFSSITGLGIKGVINHVGYYLGSANLFEEVLHLKGDRQLIQDYRRQGKTVMVFGTHDEILSVVAVADTVRDSSAQVIQDLHGYGIKNTTMLTGDNQVTALAIGNQVNVSDIQGDLMPEDKLNFVKSLKEDYGSVAMVGDGVNDAPALAIANVGIAMGGAGTDTALETADVVLMGDDLSKLPFIINISKKTLKIIKQNITFSLFIKLVALLLIIPGWLTLWIAIIADMGATLVVTFNGMRLMKIK